MDSIHIIFFGTNPTFKHVPSIRLPSIKPTFFPSLADDLAHARPLLPAPMQIKSNYLISSILIIFLAKLIKSKRKLKIFD